MLMVEDKKVVALNYSGNVGKSTICNALLLPRIVDAELFRVESINSDGHGESEKISAINYGDLLENIEMADACVVDVGSSNIETFISKMFSYKNSHEEIDLFVIPVTPDDKQISDTYSVYTFLVQNGVSEDKIKFVLNRVERNIYSPQSELDKFKKSVIAQFIDFDNVAVVYESDYYSKLQSDPRTHLEIVNDDRDFKALKKAADSKADRWEIVQAKTLYQVAQSAEDDLAEAFTKLGLGD